MFERAMKAALAGPAAALALAAAPASAQNLVGNELTRQALAGASPIAGLAYLDSRDELLVLQDVSNTSYGEEVQFHSWNGTTLAWARAAIRIPDGPAGQRFDYGTGIAVAREDGLVVLYALRSRPVTANRYQSSLFRISLGPQGTSAPVTMQVIDLDANVFELHGNKAWSLAYVDGEIVVAHERHGLPDYGDATDTETAHSRRGLRRFKIAGECAPTTCLIAAINGSTFLTRRSMPDAGWGNSSATGHNRGRDTTETRALTSYSFSDAASGEGRYLVGSIETAGNVPDEIYVAASKTGRGIFVFPSPFSSSSDTLKLAYGDGALFVADDDEVARVVLPDTAAGAESLDRLERPRRPRKIWMQQSVGGANGGLNAGWERHNFGRPHANQYRPSQDWVSGTESTSASGAAATFTTVNLSPGGASGQAIRQVEYTGVNDQALTSTYSVGFWHRYRRTFVFPHLAEDDAATHFALGSDFAEGQADDAQMFRFAQNANGVYEPFLAAVRDYVGEKYGIDPDSVDLDNPYWAARNVQDFIRGNYNYPMDASYGDFDGYVGSVNDEAAYHFDSSPSYMKLALGILNPGDGDPDFCTGGARIGAYKRVLMCASAASAFVGAMRYLGVPARWVGTSQRLSSSAGCSNWSNSSDWLASFCDVNGNAVFDGSDWMPASNGHMTTEVWLGERYGWQRFESTPTKPDDTNGDGQSGDSGILTTDADANARVQQACLDWAKLHAEEPNYVFMADFSAAGPQEKAVSTTMGVGYLAPFFKDFEDNASRDCGGTERCKGDTTYNFGLKRDDPEKRTGGSRTIKWLPLLGFTVTLSNLTASSVTVNATPTGDWAGVLPGERVEIVARKTNGTEVVLAPDLAYGFGSASVSLPLSPGTWRVLVRRKGFDRITGGASQLISR